MATMKKTLDYALKKITPTQSEQRETEAVIDEVKKVAGNIIRPFGISLTIAGSFVRDTWLPDKKEFDIFLMFPEWYSRDDLEKKGLSLGKKIVGRLKGKYIIAYAEHPYVRATVKGFDLDIVPCFKVESAMKIRSAVDRTPFHNEWLGKNLKKSQAGEVRLLKQFCKGQDIYGSDTKTQGFSGYLCELLITEHGSFENLIRHAAKWEPEILIDLENHHKDTEGVMKRFKRDPLIVIDPVDPNRNVAAALSPKNFTRFINSAKGFIKKPSQKYFFRTPRKFSINQLGSVIRKRETQLLAITLTRPKIIDDTLWPQLRKAGKRINDTLQDYDFEVMGWDVFSNKQKSFILIELSVWKLPRVRKLRGPDIFSEKRVKEFKKKYQPLGRVWVDGEFWFAETRREFTLAERKIEEFLRGPKSGLREKGIPSYISAAVAKKYSMLKEKEILRAVKTEKGFAEFLHDYLEREMI